jgi:Protein of unknown function (DUF433)
MAPQTIVYPHIERLEGESARLQRIPRIRVAQIVMDYLAYGWSVEEMYRQHPYLQLAEIYAAMGYYFDHQVEIDAEINAEWEDIKIEQINAGNSNFALRMQARGLL